MTHHEEDEQLAGWLADGPHHGPVGALEDAVARARSTRQRPGWLVGATGGTIAQRPGDTLMRYVLVAVTAVALVGLLVGAMVAGGLLPRPRPAPPIFVDNSPDPSPTDSSPTPTQPPPIGLVAYTVVEELEPGEGTCTEDGPTYRCFVNRLWLVNADGSNPHALFPDRVEGQGPLGWSSDGSRLLMDGKLGPELVDPTTSERQPLVHDDLCVYPCAGLDGYALSPDGTRLTFVRAYPDVENSSVIAILDIASGEVTELESTRTTNDSAQCWVSSQCEGMNDSPRWSPDGGRLVFARQVISPEPGSTWTSAAIYVVNPDGSDLQRVTPQGYYAIDPSWSPDGPRLVFLNVEQIVNSDGTAVDSEHWDLYAVLPDGSDLQRLTTDGISAGAEWTTDGHVTFTRKVVVQGTEDYENWIMDADGGNQRKIGNSLAELTAAGCVTCLYPLPMSENPGVQDAFWQPLP